MMPSLCGLLLFDHWELSILKKVRCFLNTLQALCLGADAYAFREFSSYYELLPVQSVL